MRVLILDTPQVSTMWFAFYICGGTSSKSDTEKD